jgi:hypothetical protein
MRIGRAPERGSFTFSPLVLHGNVPLFNGTGWAATTPSTVGSDYPLSKSTDVYAMAMHDNITGFSSGNSYGFGVRKRF